MIKLLSETKYYCVAWWGTLIHSLSNINVITNSCLFVIYEFELYMFYYLFILSLFANLYYYYLVTM